MTQPTSNQNPRPTYPFAGRVIELELIRHTRTAAAPGLCYGRTDVPLAASFPAEAQQIIDRLLAHPAGLPPTILASPLSRCRFLADRIVDAVRRSPGDRKTPPGRGLDARLQELDFGEWEGRTWEEIDATDRERSRKWMNRFVSERCPGGESYAALADRMVNAICDLLEHIVTALETEAAENPLRALVVAHAGPIRALLAHLLDLPLENSFRLQIDYGRSSTVRLRWPESQNGDRAGAGSVAGSTEPPQLPFGCSDIQILGLNQA